jgi:hypothetical protein
VAYILYFRILASSGATNLLLVTFLIPVTAILLGVLALGETLLPRHALGMLLIGAGLAAIDGRAWQRVRGARSQAPAPAGPLRPARGRVQRGPSTQSAARRATAGRMAAAREAGHAVAASEAASGSTRMSSSPPQGTTNGTPASPNDSEPVSS